MSIKNILANKAMKVGNKSIENVKNGTAAFSQEAFGFYEVPVPEELV